MQDNAPDLSMDYSFLLDSPELDRNDSTSPSSQHNFHRFAISNMAHSKVPGLGISAQRAEAGPLTGLVTPHHKQEVSSSLYRSRGSIMATGARTRIDDGGISEGPTGDESGWTLPETSPLTGGDNKCIGADMGGATGTMEERLDPLHMAFSTPIAASVAGSVAIPLLCLPDSGGPRADFFVGLPPSGKKRGKRNDANESKSSRDSRGEVENLRQQIIAQGAEIAELSMRNSVFAMVGARSSVSSPQPSTLDSVLENAQSIRRSIWKDQGRDPRADASGWTLPGVHTPGVSLIAKNALTPSHKDAQIQMLRQMLEEREEEISKFREAEHDLSMSLDRVVYELQTDIQKSKQENSILQAKLQDQVHKMGDYILRLETELIQVRQTAATSAQISTQRHIRATTGLSDTAQLQRMASSFKRHRERKRMTRALQIWIQLQKSARQIVRKATKLNARRYTWQLRLIMHCWEDISYLNQMRRLSQERTTSNFNLRCQVRAMAGWSRHASLAKRLKIKSEACLLRWMHKRKICVVAHWRLICRHRRALQRSVILCQSVAKHLEEGSIDNASIIRRCMLQWSDCTKSNVSRLLLGRLVRLDQKRMRKALSIWKHECRNSARIFANHAIVVETVRRNIQWLATNSFCNWVAFVDARRRIRMSRFAIRQKAVCMVRAVGHWVKYMCCQRRAYCCLQNVILRTSRAHLRSCMYGWRRIVEVQINLFRRQGIFIRQRAVLCCVVSIRRWHMLNLYVQHMTRATSKVQAILFHRFLMQAFKVWCHVASCSRRLNIVLTTLQIRKQKELQMAALLAWYSMQYPTKSQSSPKINRSESKTTKATFFRECQGYDLVSDEEDEHQEQHEPNRETLVAQLKEQDQQIALLENELQLQRISSQVQKTETLLELEQALAHATKMRSQTPFREREGGRMQRMILNDVSHSPARTPHLLSPLIGASPLQSHVLSIISGSNDSLFAHRPSPVSLQGDRTQFQMFHRKRSEKIVLLKKNRVRRNFIAWQAIQRESKSERLLVLKLSMCRKLSTKQVILNYAFTLWFLCRHQSLKLLVAGDALNFQCRRLLMVNCFYEWVNAIHMRQSNSSTQSYAPEPDLEDLSDLKKPIEWQVLPSPQKMPQGKEVVDSQLVQTVTEERRLWIVNCKEEILTLRFKLQQQQESAKSISNIMQQEFLGIQDECQYLLSEWEHAKQQYDFGIITPKVSLCAAEAEKTLEFQASVALRHKLRQQFQRFFSSWSWRVSRTAQIVKYGRAMYRRRMMLLTRRILLQMVQYVRTELRLRLVHTPLGALLEHATEETRQRRFASIERRVTHVFRRSIYVWSFAVWRKVVRVSKKHRHERDRADRRHFYHKMRKIKQIFEIWVAVSRKDLIQRRRTQRLKSRMEVQLVREQGFFFHMWYASAQNLRRLMRVESAIFNGKRITLMRRTFSVLELHTRILKRMLDSVLRLLKRQAFGTLTRAIAAWASVAAQHRIQNLHLKRMCLHQSCTKLITTFSEWASQTTEHQAKIKNETFAQVQEQANAVLDAVLPDLILLEDDMARLQEKMAEAQHQQQKHQNEGEQQELRMKRLFSAQLRSRRETGAKMHIFLSLQAEVHQRNSTRSRKRKALFVSSKCCRRLRAVRTMKAWVYYVRQQSRLLSTIMFKSEAVSKLSSCFTSWKQEFKRGQVWSCYWQSRKRRQILRSAFSCLCEEKKRRKHLQNLLQGCLCRQAQFKSEHVFKKWLRLSQERHLVRMYSLRSCYMFERRLFVRCCQYWFAVYRHRKSSHGRLVSLLVSTEQALVLRSLREWALATHRKRRVDSLIGMRRCSPLVLASAGIFWWRQICVREKILKIYDSIFMSFHRRHSLRRMVAVWYAAMKYVKTKKSACGTLKRKLVERDVCVKEMVFFGWFCHSKMICRFLKAFRAGTYRPLSCYGILCFQLVDIVAGLQQMNIGRGLLNRKNLRILKMTFKALKTYLRVKILLYRALRHGMKRSRKQHILKALDCWSDAQHRAHSLRVLLRRVEVKKSRHVVRKAFGCMVPRQPNAALVRLPRFGNNKLKKSSFFDAWSLIASEQRQVCKKNRRQRAQAQRHASCTLCLKMFKQWNNFTEAICSTMLQLRRFVRKWIQRRLSVIFSQWFSELCHKRTMREEVALRIPHLGFCKAWSAWKENTSLLRRQRKILFKALLRLKNALRNRTLMKWLARVKAKGQQRRLMTKISMRKRYMALRTLWLTWKYKRKDERQLKAKALKVVQRLMSAAVHSAFEKWRRRVQKCGRQQSIVKKMTARNNQAKLMRAWCTWTPVHEKSIESWCKLQHLMRCSDRNFLRKHFRLWLHVFSCSAAEENAPKAHQRTIESLRKTVTSMQSRRRMRAVLERWRASLNESYSLRRIAKTVVARSAVNILSKYLDVWIRVCMYTQQQATRISEESMIMRIRLMSKRRLEYISVRALRLTLRQHLRAWAQVTDVNSKAFARVRNSSRAWLLAYLNDWQEYVRQSATVLQIFAQISGALLFARQKDTTVWIERLKRDNMALELVAMRSNFLIKKATLDNWLIKVNLMRAMTPGVQKRGSLMRKVVRAALLQWICCARYSQILNCKLLTLTRRRTNARLWICFDRWFLQKTVQQSIAKRSTSALQLMRKALCTSTLSRWKFYVGMQHRRSRLNHEIANRVQRSSSLLLFGALKHWQGVAATVHLANLSLLRKAYDDASLQLVAKQEIIRRLQHLSFAQLLVSTIDTCQMMRSRQHLATRALFQYVKQKKLERHVQETFLSTTVRRRNSRCLYRACKGWYVYAINSRLHSVERLIETFSRQASIAETRRLEEESRRDMQQQELEEIISMVHLRFAEWDKEVHETQSLLHASCESFLPDFFFASEAQNATPDIRDLAASCSLSPNFSSWIVSGGGGGAGGVHVLCGGGREGFREALPSRSTPPKRHTRDQVRNSQVALALPVNPRNNYNTAPVFPHQAADLYVREEETSLSVKQASRIASGLTSRPEMGLSSRDREGESVRESQEAPRRFDEPQGNCRPTSPGLSTNANPQE